VVASIVSRALCALLVAILFLGACGGDEASTTRPTDLQSCGLPEADPGAEAHRVPEAYLLGGEVEVLTTEERQGRVLVALGVPYSVNDAFPRFKEAVGDTTFEVLQEDNEGFEAELYLRDGKKLGSLQIRSSTCDDVVIAYLNLPSR
jgi:hypothetical protein